MYNIYSSVLSIFHIHIIMIRLGPSRLASISLALRILVHIRPATGDLKQMPFIRPHRLFNHDALPGSTAVWPRVLPHPVVTVTRHGSSACAASAIIFPIPRRNPPHAPLRQRPTGPSSSIVEAESFARQPDSYRAVYALVCIP